MNRFSVYCKRFACTALLTIAMLPVLPSAAARAQHSGTGSAYISAILRCLNNPPVRRVKHGVWIGRAPLSCQITQAGRNTVVIRSVILKLRGLNRGQRKKVRRMIAEERTEAPVGTLSIYKGCVMLTHRLNCLMATPDQASRIVRRVLSLTARFGALFGGEENEGALAAD